MKSGKMAKMVKKQPVAFFGGRLVSFACAFLFCFTFASTYAFLYAADGGRPGGIFNFGAGARPLGMGGAHSALTRDASAVYFNPAGLGLMSGRNLSFMHAMLYEGASYDYFSYAQNFRRLSGAWGGQLLRLNVGDIEGRYEFNAKTSNISYTETAFAAGGGLSGILYPGLSAGFSAKVLNRSLAGESDNLIGFDAGLQYGPLYGDRLNLSFVAQNLGAFSTGDTSDRLPFIAKAGASCLLAGSVMLAADISSDRVLRMGTEYVMGPAALRVGYGRGDISFGAGVKFLKAYSFDLATVKSSDLGVSNRFSLGYLFGGAGQPPRAETYARDYLASAEAELKEASWLKAYDDIAMAIGVDSGLKKGPWGERYLRLGEVMKGLKLREMPEREANFKGSAPAAAEAALAVREYLEGRTVKSMLLAHSACGYAPDNAFYSEVLRALSTFNSREVIKDEILPRPMLINSKLEKASAAFYAQNFEKTVKECSEVLVIDEGNADAWKKLGSAYFALGDMSGAKRAYGKALELNPQDASTIKFMGLQGWK